MCVPVESLSTLCVPVVEEAGGFSEEEQFHAGHECFHNVKTTESEVCVLHVNSYQITIYTNECDIH